MEKGEKTRSEALRPWEGMEKWRKKKKGDIVVGKIKKSDSDSEGTRYKILGPAEDKKYIVFENVATHEQVVVGLDNEAVLKNLTAVEE